MRIEFDPAKDAANLAKHGVSLAVAGRLDWENALIWTDTRQHYSEPRQAALGLIGDRVYFVAFVDRGNVRRIISFRKANYREAKYYVETLPD
jgi:uncharacterized DUF497 family protein